MNVMKSVYTHLNASATVSTLVGNVIVRMALNVNAIILVGNVIAVGMGKLVR
jgi:hypothetical protein